MARHAEQRAGAALDPEERACWQRVAVAYRQLGERTEERE
jgi:hypothetical protein